MNRLNRIKNKKEKRKKKDKTNNNPFLVFYFVCLLILKILMSIYKYYDLFSRNGPYMQFQRPEIWHMLTSL